jgi:tetratricopeptide (TPR) repeat protein
MHNRPSRILLGAVVLIIVTIGVYNLPFVHDRLAWRIDDWRTRIVYFFSPPEDVVFVPTQQVISTLSVTNTPQPTMTVSVPTSQGPTVTPTDTPVPLPPSVDLRGDRYYVDQFERWNYCGPANLAMALKFWGWKGTRDDIAEVIKPGENDPKKSFIDRGKTDRNVMPYELANYVQDYTDDSIVIRYGGDIGLVKRLLAAGFPVLIEKGYYEKDYSGKIGWLGHYSFVTGYDDSKGSFIYQEAYPQPKTVSGKNRLIAYQDFIEGWRSFDFLFMVIYPSARENEVFNLLGPWADSGWADGHALDIATQEVRTFSGQTDNDEFFAWFNQGTSYARLQQYGDSATSFDKAFQIYSALGNDNRQRPYRILWYQTWAYWAYFYTGRYQDVINLANATLDTVEPPTLEDTIYWRAMAEYAVGDTPSAYKDMRQVVYLNKNFQAGLAKLQEWGIQP